MTVSYSIPLLVLLGMAWLVDFAEAPIPIQFAFIRSIFGILRLQFLLVAHSIGLS